MAIQSPSLSSVSKDHQLGSIPQTIVRSSKLRSQDVFGYGGLCRGTDLTQLKLRADLKTSSRLRATREPTNLTRKPKHDEAENVTVTENESDVFDELKERFLNFKKQKYRENTEHFEQLAKGQAPKFMVIACADSRVCPSSILGFQPGEAFVVRNVANMVPPYESGPSETNAALEFAVNSLKVENILVIGHSRCGGIRALMSMHDDVETSSFIGSWVSVGMHARRRTRAAASKLSFDQQCKHCEKESINCSLVNLLTYPWLEEKVSNGELSIHGSYYDFVDCTFEKWTLDYKKGNVSKESSEIAVKDQSFWC